MDNFFRCWAGWIALGCGALSGFGILRSEKLVFWLGLGTVAAQVLCWDALFVVFKRPGENGGIALAGGYFLGLLAALPYTAIGAVLMAEILAVVRPRDRGTSRRSHSGAGKSRRVNVHNAIP